MANKLTFTVENREVKGQEPAKILIDSEGFICGIFSSETEAKTAIPKITRSIEARGVNLKTATFRQVRPNQNVSYSDSRKNQYRGQRK